MVKLNEQFSAVTAVDSYLSIEPTGVGITPSGAPQTSAPDDLNEMYKERMAITLAHLREQVESFERPYSNEELEELIQNGSAEDINKISEELRNTPQYKILVIETINRGPDEFFKVIDADEVTEILKELEISPYYLMPALLQGDNYESLFSYQNNLRLSEAGVDIKGLHDAMVTASNGERNLLAETESNLRNQLTSPYITLNEDITATSLNNLPAPFLDSLKRDLELYEDLRFYLTPDTPFTGIDEFLVSETDTPYSPTISSLADRSYEQALHNRERNTGRTMENVGDKMIEEYSYLGLESYEGGINFLYATDLNLPEQSIESTLIVTEGIGDVHGDATHRYSAALTTLISPDGPTKNDVVFIPTEMSDNKASTITMAAYTDNLIFSRSYAYRSSTLYQDGKLTQDINPRLDEVIKYEFFENNGAVNFVAAGNSYSHIDPRRMDLNFVNIQMIENSYASATQIFVSEGHTQKGVIVGAGQINDGIKYMTSYSSQGATFLSETPDFYGAKIQGTSFSTPTAASYYKEVFESFGADLSHEEIMLAALYSTDMDIYDVNAKDAQRVGVQLNSKTVDANNAETFSNEKDLPGETIQEFNKVLFHTNDAGIPHHYRAGAGFLDVSAWVENLETLRDIKATGEYNEDYISTRVMPEEDYYGTDDNTFQYRYTIPITQDMTLDKQTLFTGELGNNAIRITSPSGMQADFTGTLTGYISTHAFAGEDVKTGDVLVIESRIELDEDAELTLRGHGDGSAIQAFRQAMLEQNGIEPNQVYSGGEQQVSIDDLLGSSQIRQMQSTIDHAMDREEGRNNDGRVMHNGVCVVGCPPDQ